MAFTKFIQEFKDNGTGGWTFIIPEEFRLPHDSANDLAREIAGIFGVGYSEASLGNVFTVRVKDGVFWPDVHNKINETVGAFLGRVFYPDDPPKKPTKHEKSKYIRHWTVDHNNVQTCWATKPLAPTCDLTAVAWVDLHKRLDDIPGLALCRVGKDHVKIVQAPNNTAIGKTRVTDQVDSIIIGHLSWLDESMEHEAAKAKIPKNPLELLLENHEDERKARAAVGAAIFARVAIEREAGKLLAHNDWPTMVRVGLSHVLKADPESGGLEFIEFEGVKSAEDLIPIGQAKPADETF